LSQFPNQEVLIIKASGHLWNFFYNQKSIFYKVCNSDGKWSESIRLMENVLDDFSVDIDPSDKIHLVCMDNKGQILYFTHNGTNWYNKCLSIFPLEKYSLKYLTISTWSEHINILFALNLIKNPSLWTIQHNFWNGSKWKNSKVVRINAIRNFGPFYTGYDYTGSIHMIYKAPLASVHQLYYCKFHPEYLIWSNPEKITGTGNDNSHPYILTDNKDTLHLVFNCPVKNNLQIKYMQKTRISYPKGFWKNETTVSTSDKNNIHPLIYIINRTLWIVWMQQNTLLGSFSYDSGKNWTSPVQLDVPLNSEMKIFNIGSNNKEYSNMGVTLAFGYKKGNDIILPVIENALNKSQNKALEKTDKKGSEIIDKKPVEIDDKRLKEYTAQTKNYVSKLSEEIDKIEEYKKDVEGKIFMQTNEMAKNRQNMEQIKKDVVTISEKLENLKKENIELVSSIRNWQKKYKDNQQIIKEIEEKHKNLLEEVERLTKNNFIQKILDYFK